MGEYAEMMLDGTCCAGCGEFMHGDGHGFPGYCSRECALEHGSEHYGRDYKPVTRPKKPKPVSEPKSPKTVTCPKCGKETRQGKSMQHHLKDAHGMDGMAAHLIANPNDKQARNSTTGRRTYSKPRGILGRGGPDDFDVIDEGAQ